MTKKKKPIPSPLMAAFKALSKMQEWRKMPRVERKDKKSDEKI